jgi:hypothetical protein
MDVPTFIELDFILENFEKNKLCELNKSLIKARYDKLTKCSETNIEEDYSSLSIIRISFFDAKQVCNIIDSKESCENGMIIPFYGDSLYHIYFLYFSIKGPRLFRIKNNGSDIKLCTSGFGLSIDP